MKLYLDNKNKIIAVNSTDRSDLKEIELDETAYDFPFTGWSETRICCYRVEVQDGHISMITPYVPTYMISVLENLASENKKLARKNAELEDALCELSMLIE